MFFFFFNEKSEAFFWGFDQFFVSKVFSKHVFLGGFVLSHLYFDDEKMVE